MELCRPEALLWMILNKMRNHPWLMWLAQLVELKVLRSDSLAGHIPRWQVDPQSRRIRSLVQVLTGRQPTDASLLHQCFAFSLPISLKAMKKRPQVKPKNKK